MNDSSPNDNTLTQQGQEKRRRIVSQLEQLSQRVPTQLCRLPHTIAIETLNHFDNETLKNLIIALQRIEYINIEQSGILRAHVSKRIMDLVDEDTRETVKECGRILQIALSILLNRLLSDNNDHRQQHQNGILSHRKRLEFYTNVLERWHIQTPLSLLTNWYIDPNTESGQNTLRRLREYETETDTTTTPSYVWFPLLDLFVKKDTVLPLVVYILETELLIYVLNCGLCLWANTRFNAQLQSFVNPKNDILQCNFSTLGISSVQQFLNNRYILDILNTSIHDINNNTTIITSPYNKDPKIENYVRRAQHLIEILREKQHLFESQQKTCALDVESCVIFLSAWQTDALEASTLSLSLEGAQKLQDIIRNNTERGVVSFDPMGCEGSLYPTHNHRTGEVNVLPCISEAQISLLNVLGTTYTSLDSEFFILYQSDKIQIAHSGTNQQPYNIEIRIPLYEIRDDDRVGIRERRSTTALHFEIENNPTEISQALDALEMQLNENIITVSVVGESNSQPSYPKSLPSNVVGSIVVGLSITDVVRAQKSNEIEPLKQSMRPSLFQKLERTFQLVPHQNSDAPVFWGQMFYYRKKLHGQVGKTVFVYDDPAEYTEDNLMKFDFIEPIHHNSNMDVHRFIPPELQNTMRDTIQQQHVSSRWPVVLVRFSDWKFSGQDLNDYVDYEFEVDEDNNNNDDDREMILKYSSDSAMVIENPRPVTVFLNQNGNVLLSQRCRLSPLTIDTPPIDEISMGDTMHNKEILVYLAINPLIVLGPVLFHSILNPNDSQNVIYSSVHSINSMLELLWIDLLKRIIDNYPMDDTVAFSDNVLRHLPSLVRDRFLPLLQESVLDFNDNLRNTLPTFVRDISSLLKIQDFEGASRLFRQALEYVPSLEQDFTNDFISNALYLKIFLLWFVEEVQVVSRNPNDMTVRIQKSVSFSNFEYFTDPNRIRRKVHDTVDSVYRFFLQYRNVMLQIVGRPLQFTQCNDINEDYRDAFGQGYDLNYTLETIVQRGNTDSGNASPFSPFGTEAFQVVDRAQEQYCLETPRVLEYDFECLGRADNATQMVPTFMTALNAYFK